jgi:hypothetical protein
LLTPTLLFDNVPTKVDDDATLIGLAESVHPVRRAEIAFKLLGKAEEFVQNYEQNRFGDVKIGKKGDEKNEKRSSLSSLTGDDVILGTDRIFFAKFLLHLCSFVVGFSAIEAALELGHFVDEDDLERDIRPPVSRLSQHCSGNHRRSRNVPSLPNWEIWYDDEPSEVGTNLAELVPSSCLMAAFRSALKIVHPSKEFWPWMLTF